MSTCAAPAIWTVQLQPVYYQEFFPYTTVIDPFRDGHLYTISQAPTEVFISSTLTRIISPFVTPTTITVDTSTAIMTSSSTISVSTVTTSSVSFSQPTTTTSTTIQKPSSTEQTTGASSSSSTNLESSPTLLTPTSTADGGSSFITDLSSNSVTSDMITTPTNPSTSASVSVSDTLDTSTTTGIKTTQFAGSLESSTTSASPSTISSELVSSTSPASTSTSTPEGQIPSRATSSSTIATSSVSSSGDSTTSVSGSGSQTTLSSALNTTTSTADVTTISSNSTTTFSSITPITGSTTSTIFDITTSASTNDLANKTTTAMPFSNSSMTSSATLTTESLSITSNVSTTTSGLPTTVPCPNCGLQIAYQDNTNCGGDPAYFQTAPMNYTTISSSVGYSYVRYNTTVYGRYGNYEGCWGWNHRGYIFATQTGPYTFNSPHSDDWGVVWIGNKAYSGYTQANSDLYQRWTQGAMTFTRTFQAGEYYPFRILWINTGQLAVLTLTVSRPDGVMILNSTTPPSQEIVWQSPDGILAAPFPYSFGNEATH